MTRGAYISGLGHGAFLLWMVLGGMFMSVRDLTPLQVSDVSMITSEEFAALMSLNDAPSIEIIDPQPVAPVVEDAPPVVVQEPDQSPPQPTPDEASEPVPEITPLTPQTPPEPPLQGVDDTALAPSPLVEETPPVLAKPDDVAVPVQAPRVAEETAPEVAPDTQVADTVTPEIVPGEQADQQAEETPASAPEEAATEIVTEAEIPASAPIKSPRPRVRPKRPVPTEVVVPEKPQADAVAEAVAQAVANDTPQAPTGPPLTGSEKDALRISVQKCWNVGSLSSEAISTTVVVGVRMARDGRPEGGSLRLLSFSGGSERAANQAYGAARRAIIRCGAKGFDLPVEKYSQWQDIEMTFNPEGMRLK